MSAYKAPLRDILFCVNEVLDFEQHYLSIPGCDEINAEMLESVFEEAGNFGEQVLAPLNAIGDEQGCQFDQGKVTTPKGFKEAYWQFVENGWYNLAMDPELGGQGLPPSVNTVCFEMQAGANHAWAMYGSLTWGAVSTLSKYAPQNVKDLFLEKMVAGQWSGTMCLTEPHCGTDLGLLSTKAERLEDGSYSITGTKIFISAGEHDINENIIHIVLARIAGAPKGVKGISLFVVPRNKVEANGGCGENNNVSCSSIEHKMGIHGNATCVINFDNAHGYLLGKENDGLRCMFSFINESRLGVAQQGQAHIERSFQLSYNYAAERKQSKGFSRSTKNAADPIIVHADVRRMILNQKVFAEGGRLLTYDCGLYVDKSKLGEDKAVREEAEMMLAFLTPIAKGFLTEISLESTSQGMQVLGGHGYIRESGLEQEYRDARITAIYEGTNGIQALDLLGRKVLGSQGKLLEMFCQKISTFCAQYKNDNEHAVQLLNSIKQWQKLTMHIAEKSQENMDEMNAAAYEYLMYSGYVVLAYYWLRAEVAAKKALDAKGTDQRFYNSKISTSNYYYEKILPRINSLAETIMNGSGSVMEIDNEDFIF
ncbi:MAG: acyl-CoA dehydrogenase C-terminal domain-containing protein [bacterium]